jgi:hypothetical protein
MRTDEHDSQLDRLDVLRYATDRAAADDRTQWAIISTLLRAISSDQVTTDRAVQMLDILTVPRSAAMANLKQALRSA